MLFRCNVVSDVIMLSGTTPGKQEQPVAVLPIHGHFESKHK